MERATKYSFKIAVVPISRYEDHRGVMTCRETVKQTFENFTAGAEDPEERVFSKTCQTLRILRLCGEYSFPSYGCGFVALVSWPRKTMKKSRALGVIAAKAAIRFS
jgi:hypothetical protein